MPAQYCTGRCDLTWDVETRRAILFAFWHGFGDLWHNDMKSAFLSHKKLPLLVVTDHPLRGPIVVALKVGFDYLHNRIEGNCAEHLSYRGNMSLFKSLRLFDPRRAIELNMTSADIDTVFAELPALTQCPRMS